MVNVPNWMTIEAINAVSVLTGTGKLKEAVAVAEGWLLERHKQATSYEGMPVGKVSPQIRDEWRALSVSQCPFMTEDKRCLIHQVRPLACRAFGVTRDAAEICPRPPGKGETLTQRIVIKSDAFKKTVDAFTDSCKNKNPEWIIRGFVPSLLYRAAEPEKFRKMVKDNQIATAKAIGINYDVSLMWQPQVEALRSGMSPDLVAAMNK